MTPSSDAPEQPGNEPAPSDEPMATPGPALGGGVISWIVLTAIGAAALAMAFAHLPAAFKKLGLFAVAYGLSVGLTGGWLAQSALVRTRPWFGTIVVVLLAVAGQIGIAAESFRLERLEEQRLERAIPNQVLARRLLESAEEPPDAKSRATFDEFRRTYSHPADSFGDYLEFRVSNLGIRSKPAAALFWVVEVGLGALAAGWIFRRRGGTNASARQPATAFDATGGAAKLEE